MGVPRIFPEWLGANVAVSGIPDLTTLKEGSRIIFPRSRSLCEGENDPCIQVGEVIQSYYPEQPKLAPAFVRHALGIRGIVCIVERPGVVYAGDEIEVHSYQRKVKRKAERV